MPYSWCSWLKCATLGLLASTTSDRPNLSAAHSLSPYICHIVISQMKFMICSISHCTGHKQKQKISHRKRIESHLCTCSFHFKVSVCSQKIARTLLKTALCLDVRTGGTQNIIKVKTFSCLW